MTVVNAMTDLSVLTTSILCSAVIYFLQLNLIKNRPLRRNPNSPATFFPLGSVVSTKRLNNLAAIYAFPFAVLFFGAANKADYYVAALSYFFESYIGSSLNNKPFTDGIFEAGLLWNWVDPLILLIIASFFFLPYVRAPLIGFRDFVLFVVGIDARASRLATRAARKILSKLTLKQARGRISEEFATDLPLPEELVDSSEEAKLGYQILYVGLKKTMESGISSSMSDIENRFGHEEPIEPPLPELTMNHLLGAGSFYLSLCIAYIALIPLAQGFLTDSTIVQSFFQPFEWPLPDKRDALLYSVGTRSLSFVLPLAVGMYLYSLRRFRKTTDHLDESALRSFAVVVCLQFLISFFANTVSDGWTILKSRTPGFEVDEGSLPSFDQIKIWVELFLSSIASSVALAAWIFTGKLASKWIGCVAISAASAVCFFFAEYVFESFSQLRGYYWHELIFGVFLGLAYCISALIADIFVVPPRETHGDIDVGSERATIFISYRRQDLPGMAFLIYEKISERYNIFIDIARVQPAANLSKKIGQALRESDLLLALIGPGWAGDTSTAGSRKIDEPDDWIRVELETAFRIGIPIAPVLLEEAIMPNKAEVPKSLSALCNTLALQIRLGKDFDSDILKLFGMIDGELKRKASESI